jgi:hypothetical protein
MADMAWSRCWSTRGLRASESYKRRAEGISVSPKNPGETPLSIFWSVIGRKTGFHFC